MRSSTLIIAASAGVASAWPQMPRASASDLKATDTQFPTLIPAGLAGLPAASGSGYATGSGGVFPSGSGSVIPIGSDGVSSHFPSYTHPPYSTGGISQSGMNGGGSGTGVPPPGPTATGVYPPGQTGTGPVGGGTGTGGSGGHHTTTVVPPPSTITITSNVPSTTTSTITGLTTITQIISELNQALIPMILC